MIIQEAGVTGFEIFLACICMFSFFFSLWRIVSLMTQFFDYWLGDKIVEYLQQFLS